MKIHKQTIKYSRALLFHDILIEENGYWGIDANKYLVFNDKAVAKLPREITQEFRFFRKIGNDFFLIVNDNDKKENAWIISKTGKIQHRFYVGDGAYKVHIQNDRIFICYGEATIGLCPIGTNRLVIFDIKGNILEKYDLEFGQEIEAICYYSEHEIALQEYCSLEISILNFVDNKWTKYRTDSEFYADILTCRNGKLYGGFLSKYWEDEEDIRNGQMNIYEMKKSERTNEISQGKMLGSVPYFISKVRSQNDGVLVFTDAEAYLNVNKVPAFWTVDVHG